MENVTLNNKIGDIVARIPKAAEVFKIYSIDFCCGGHRPLTEAVKEGNLNGQEVLEALEKAAAETEASTGGNYLEMSAGELIDHIEATHHVFVKKILPELSDLTTTILRVHGPTHPDLFKVHKLFHNLKTELDQHLIKEEEILFPQIKAYAQNPQDAALDKVVTVMRETEEEHNTAGDVLKELRRITSDYSIPEDVCGTYVYTFDQLQALEADLFQHIHLENNILFHQLPS